MPGRVPRSSVIGPLLRSVTPVTGALAGGFGVAVPILAATVYEMKFGRPSSTSGLGIPFGVIFGAVAAGLGAAVGRGVQEVVARSRWAGPIDRRAAGLLVMLVVTVPTIVAIDGVRRMEAENTPRVIRSAGEISRAQGWSRLTPFREATFLWVGFPHPDHPLGELHWNGRPVSVRVTDGRLMVNAGDLPPTTIDISRFDYAREVYGITARLSSSGPDWLALLVQLRSTGGRDLLFLVSPQGVLAHEELIDRHRARVPRVGLGVAGPADRPQEIVLDRGVPIRYFVNAGAAR